MGKQKAYEPKPGEWVQLSLPPFTNRDVCCGCGLVHRFDFKLVKVSRGKGMTIWRRMFLDNRGTAQVRKARLATGEIYKTTDGWYIAPFPINERRMKQRKRRKK